MSNLHDGPGPPPPEDGGAVGRTPGLAPGPPTGPNRLGKYHISRLLGKGGMGVVYQAQDTLLQRQVAVKVLARSLSSDAELLERFLREARATALLNHPNVVAVHEIAQHGDAWYIVMELLEGGSTQDLLAGRGRLPWPDATRAVAGACRGLAAAHAAGLIHRDLKPANILLARDATAKLADFGLVRWAVPATRGLTATDQVLGTPTYMSPEQGRSEPADERSDIYSLGATYYALLTGVPPFSGNGPLDVLFAHCTHPIPDPRAHDPGIPGGCTTIVQRALAKEPANRYQSAADLLAALEAVLGATTTPLAPADVPSPPAGAKSRRRWPAVTAAFVVLGLLLLAAVPVVLRGLRPDDADPHGDKDSSDQAGRAPERPLALPWPVGNPGPALEVSGAVEAIAFAPRGRALAVAGGDPGVQVWDWTARKEVRLWAGQGIRSLAFSADGQTLAAGAKGGVRLLSLRDGRESELAVEGPVLCVAFGPDGETLAAAVASAERKGVDVRVWDWPGCEVRHTLRGPSGNGFALAFSAERGILAVGGEDGAVGLWDLPAGHRLPDLSVSHPVRALAFSPPSRLAVRPPGRYLTVAHDAGLQFWDVRPGRWELAFQESTGTSPVTGVAYSPDCRFLAFAYAGGKVRVRNNLTGKTSWIEAGGPGPGTPGPGRVAFGPNGDSLAAVDGRAVRLWDLSDR